MTNHKKTIVEIVIAALFIIVAVQLLKPNAIEDTPQISMLETGQAVSVEVSDIVSDTIRATGDEIGDIINSDGVR